MITPKLEELILKGRAFFKTFVAGGEKHTLNIDEDRFIIITDITYFPMNAKAYEGNPGDNWNTQLAIYGNRGYNHFIFRNFNSRENNIDSILFSTPVTINTYLMHTEQVGFSFCNAHSFRDTSIGLAKVDNPSYRPPLEYGKDGDPGAINVILTQQSDTPGPIQIDYSTRPAPSLTESTQLFFPFNDGTRFNLSLDKNPQYPLVHVNYVEILGLPNNLGI